ncbi:MAG: hypothetical protein F6K24_46100 [Okeania sp. SIO2D1]|nr:hypothetical protein [Okeania sp. SIO2D1]
MNEASTCLTSTTFLNKELGIGKLVYNMNLNSLGVSPQESGGKKEEETQSRKIKFFGERKGRGVLSRSYPDMVSYLKLPTPELKHKNNKLKLSTKGNKAEALITQFLR